ncbi:hypothetical protein B9Z19DRAFT_1053269 [Tuber borchii]|uniref:Beta/gamma crystallin 'Greek key' domain-containing protein n=1 Tax=Tuber borchii TaxID=42251 RepID=A0A2T6ZJX9_TUBBO|nr:hypothetical protein B9Z19DRAFT_1053269 [Tuber borchii]
MQAKIFLSSLLATLLAVGVIATPAGVVARDVGTSHSLNGAITPLEQVATVGATKPRPNGPVTTPKAGDVPFASTSVEARDLESLAKRTLGCVYVTQDANFAGTSAYICSGTWGGCITFTNPWRYTISSFGPDGGTYCQIFHSTDCSSGGSTTFTYPGYGNLGAWNDNLGSYRCWW